MKNFLNFQQFEIESTNSFLNVATAKELKEWKKLLRMYYYLHNMGIKFSKKNRAALLETLAELKITQKELGIMFDNCEPMEKKQGHIEAVEKLQDMLMELSLIRDEVIISYEPIEKMKTMIYFESIEHCKDGSIIFKTRNKKRFQMQNQDNYNNHVNFIKKYMDMIDERKKSEKKMLKNSPTKEEKAQRKSDNFTEKVNEKKRKD